MKSNLGTMVLKFVGDTSALTKSFDQVEKEVKQAAKGLYTGPMRQRSLPQYNPVTGGGIVTRLPRPVPVSMLGRTGRTPGMQQFDMNGNLLPTPLPGLSARSVPITRLPALKNTIPITRLPGLSPVGSNATRLPGLQAIARSSDWTKFNTKPPGPSSGGSSGLSNFGIGAAVAGANLAAQGLLGTFNMVLSAAQGIASAMYDVSRYVAVTGSDFEATRTAFQSLLASTEGGNKLFKELQQFAIKTPFGIGEVQDVGKQLLGRGIPAKDLLEIMRQIGEVSAGTGTEIKLVGKAYSDVIGKGKLMAQELNLQLGNAGIGADAFARALGISTARLNQMMHDGLVTSEMFQQAFATLAGKGFFGGGMQRQLQTVKGAFSQIKETITATAGNLGDAIFTKFPIAKTINEVAESLNNVDLDRIVSNVEAIWGAIRPAAESMAKFGLGAFNSAKQFSGSFMPVIETLSGAVGTFFDNFGARIVKIGVLFGHLGVLIGEQMMNAFDVTSRFMKPFMDAWDLAHGNEMGTSYGPLAATSDQLRAALMGSRVGLSGINVDKAFSEANQQAKDFFGKASGAGGVSPISAEEENARRARDEVDAKNKAFMDAMEKSMPGFKAGISDLLKDAVDPKGSMSPYALAMRNMNFLYGAASNPGLFGGMAGINRAILSNWDTLAGSANKLPDPIAKSIRAGSQEAYSIVNAARNDNAGSVEDMMRQTLQIIRQQNEERLRFENQQLEALNTLVRQGEFGGVGMGGGR